MAGTVFVYLGAVTWWGVALLLAMDVVRRLDWGPAARTFAAVWLVFYVGTTVVRHIVDAARDWCKLGPDGTPPDEPALAFLRHRVYEHAVNVTDITGRWTVAALLWTIPFYVIDSRVFFQPATLDVSRLIDGYISLALIVGPVGGLVWWCASSEYYKTLPLGRDAARQDALSTVVVSAVAGAIVVLALGLV